MSLVYSPHPEPDSLKGKEKEKEKEKKKKRKQEFKIWIVSKEERIGFCPKVWGSGFMS